MERRSWPWKKKSSEKLDKTTVLSSTGVVATSSHGVSNVDQEMKKSDCIQISMETYAHLRCLEEQLKMAEDQIQTLEDEINDLNEKLAEAQLEMTTKDELVKQHAKVAEEAVSGWEKAESEAATLKSKLESQTVSKQAAEDRGVHLDIALKECTRQIRNLKEEHEYKLHEVVFAKAKQWENIKLELETKISKLDGELMKAVADNSVLSRSLQEHGSMMVKMSEEKAQVEEENEILKNSIESYERETHSLKYELRIVSKELEIRNEEKNMSMRSADAALKQQMESGKKITKLEAECQRLRGLLRKKLPSPAAVAKMKLEVESFSWGHRSPPFRSPPNGTPSPPFPHENGRRPPENGRLHDERELLAGRLFALEEETKMLRDALTMRNTELHASRNLCAKTSLQLQSLETQIRSGNQVKSSSLSTPRVDKPSLTYFSEERFDHAESCARKQYGENVSPRSENERNMDLMDDFIEMEKLAQLNTNGPPHCSSSLEGDPCTEMQNTSSFLRFTAMDSAIDDRKLPDDLPQHPDNMVTAVSQIHEFVLLLGKEIMKAHDSLAVADDFQRQIEGLSFTFNEPLQKQMDLARFVYDLSHVLAQASNLRFNVVGYKGGNEMEISSPDCVDKVVLPQNKLESSPEELSSNLSSTSNPEVPDDGNLLVLGCDSQEEVKKLKLEKENMTFDLAISLENLEKTNNKLVEADRLLSDARSQLDSLQKAAGLADTQLKCMTESYRCLETRANALESEIRVLRSTSEALEMALADEKRLHRDALVKCQELEQQLQTNESCCSICSAAETELKEKQDRELAAAAKKLGECQETIFLLGKQLNALRPPAAEQVDSSPRSRSGSAFTDDEKSSIVNSYHEEQEGNRAESPSRPLSGGYYPGSSSDTETPLQRNSGHKHSKSGSSSFSAPTPDRNSRGFSRFFTTKGKSSER